MMIGKYVLDLKLYLKNDNWSSYMPEIGDHKIHIAGPNNFGSKSHFF